MGLECGALSIFFGLLSVAFGLYFGLRGFPSALRDIRDESAQGG